MKKILVAALEIILQIFDLFFGDKRGNFHRIRCRAKTYQVGDTIDENRSFAAARACQQKQRSLCGQDRLLLHGIQMFKPAGNDLPPRSQKTLLKCMIHMFTYLL